MSAPRPPRAYRVLLRLLPAREGGALGRPGVWAAAVRDVKHYGLDEPMRPGLYFSAEASPIPSLVAVLWTAVPLTGLVPQVRGVVRALDPELPLFLVGTMGEAVERPLAVRRAYSRVIGAFAAMALLLALGGIYGVSATDPATFAGVAAILAGAALLATLVPARRALSVDPRVVLREE